MASAMEVFAAFKLDANVNGVGSSSCSERCEKCLDESPSFPKTLCVSEAVVKFVCLDVGGNWITGKGRPSLGRRPTGVVWCRREYLVVELGV